MLLRVSRWRDKSEPVFAGLDCGVCIWCTGVVELSILVRRNLGRSDWDSLWNRVSVEPLVPVLSYYLVLLIVLLLQYYLRVVRHEILHCGQMRSLPYWPGFRIWWPENELISSGLIVECLCLVPAFSAHCDLVRSMIYSCVVVAISAYSLHGVRPVVGQVICDT